MGGQGIRQAVSLCDAVQMFCFVRGCQGCQGAHEENDTPLTQYRFRGARLNCTTPLLRVQEFPLPAHLAADLCVCVCVCVRVYTRIHGNEENA
jgi:hypothetical protein